MNDENTAAAPTIRLFTALPVSAELARQLAALPVPKPYAADDYHITLRFLGDIDEAQLPDVTEALRSVRRDAFRVEVRGLGLFENPRQTILYASVESARKMTALAATINEKLAPLGFEMPNKPFVPHVTVGRFKNGSEAAMIAKRHSGRIMAGWHADSFALMRSGDDNHAGRFATLEKFELNADY